MIPAAFPDSGHVEDEITALAMATALEGYADMPDFVSACANQAREKIIQSGRPAALEKKIVTGGEDTRIAMDIDRYPQILYVNFSPSDFAQVVE